MTSFDQLIYEVEKLEGEDVNDYLDSFFSSVNKDNYLIDQRANNKETVAILKMFGNEECSIRKASEVLKDNPLCLEAAYVYFKLVDEEILNQYLNGIKNIEPEYENLSAYSKYAYIAIMHWYVDFLCNIHNITAAIKILKAVMLLDNKQYEADINRLAYLYSLIEEKDAFYELYLKDELKSSIAYLLLIVVLLKHDEDVKAKEVLQDLISVNKYADYIDHIWDIEDSDDEDAIEFVTSCNVLSEEFESIPSFFTWCSNSKEKVLKS